MCYSRPMSRQLGHQTQILSQSWERISSQGWDMSYDQVHRGFSSLAARNKPFHDAVKPALSYGMPSFISLVFQSLAST